MKNTLNNVIETLESKGYEFEYDETITVLEITSPGGAYEDITPRFIRDGKVESLFIIPDFLDEDLGNVCIDFYGYTLNFPNAQELIKEIENTFNK